MGALSKRDESNYQSSQERVTAKPVQKMGSEKEDK
jgi:hypothetical protein